MEQLEDKAHLINLRMSIMKPLGAQWLVSLYDYLNSNRSIVINGFKAAGILDVLHA